MKDDFDVVKDDLVHGPDGGVCQDLMEEVWEDVWAGKV